MVENDGYIGHKVTALLASATPLLMQLDPNDLAQRLALASCGGLGALLVLISDRPKTWVDFLGRITGGVTSCFLFGPWVATRLGQDTLNGVLLTFGLIGASSWYVLGSATKGLIALRESNGVRDFFVAWVRGRIVIQQAPPGTPPPSVTVPVSTPPPPSSPQPETPA